MPKKSTREADHSAEVLSHVLSQVHDATAKAELNDLEDHCGIEWLPRVEGTIRRVVPYLVKNSVELKEKIEARLNAIHDAIALVNDSGKWGGARLPKEIVKVQRCLKGHLAHAASMSANLRSQEVSAVFQDMLTEGGFFEALRLKKNSGSTYPDCYPIDNDYSLLPAISRGGLSKSRKAAEGPNLKKAGNPSNVPDGCEVKANEGKSVHVDAHAKQVGLHVAVTWGRQATGRFVITGVWAGYMRKADYTEVARNHESTTVKYSFGHSRFVSLLPPTAPFQGSII